MFESSLKWWTSPCSSVFQGEASNHCFKEHSTNAQWYNLKFGQAHPPWGLSRYNVDHLMQGFFPFQMNILSSELSFCQNPAGVGKGSTELIKCMRGSTFIFIVVTRAGIDEGSAAHFSRWSSTFFQNGRVIIFRYCLDTGTDFHT